MYCIILLSPESLPLGIISVSVTGCIQNLLHTLQEYIM